MMRRLWLRASGGRAWLTAMALGALSALALPPLFLLPALPLAICGLLALLGGCARWRRAALLGFCFGFGHHCVGLYWITDAILIESARFWWLVPIAVPGLAAVLAVFVAVACLAAWRAPPGWRRVAVLGGAWVLTDLARSFVATGFPWNPLGSVWALPGRLGDVFLQPAALLGVHGLTLATVILAGLPSLSRRAWLAGLAALALWGGFGLWRLGAATTADPGVSVALVQGNIAQGHKWDRAFVLDIFHRYLDLTRQGAASARAARPGDRIVVVWPETASPFLLETDQPARAAMIEAAGADATVLAGAIRYDSQQRPRNSLIAVTSAAGPAAAQYDKWHLVPFGEYQPWWVPAGLELVPGDGLVPGPGPRTMRLPGLPAIGPLICYEAIFPAAVVDEGDRPEWMVNVTNDAWFGDSSGPRQHLAAARMRAVEEGLPLFRAANTGISAAFDAFGHELGRLEIGRGGTVIARLPGRLPRPPDTYVGLWGPAAAALAGVLAGLLQRRPRRPIS